MQVENSVVEDGEESYLLVIRVNYNRLSHVQIREDWALIDNARSWVGSGSLTVSVCGIFFRLLFVSFIFRDSVSFFIMLFFSLFLLFISRRVYNRLSRVLIILNWISRVSSWLSIVSSWSCFLHSLRKELSKLFKLVIVIHTNFRHIVIIARVLESVIRIKINHH